MTAWPVVLVCLVGSGSQAIAAPRVSASQNAEVEVNRLALTLVDFEERIDEYMDLREDIADELADAESTTDVARIRAREEALASRIRAARRGAKHGDIFTPAIRAAFRRLLAPHTSRIPLRRRQCFSPFRPFLKALSSASSERTWCCSIGQTDVILDYIRNVIR